MPDSFADFAVKLDRLNTKLGPAGIRAITTKVAVAAKKDVAVEVVKDVGADLRMSGWARVRFDSGFKLVSDHVAKLTPRPAGPWMVLEDGRKAAASSKRSKPGIRATPWGPRTYKAGGVRARVGRTAGHHTFQHATTTIKRETPRRVHTEVVRALQEVF